MTLHDADAMMSDRTSAPPPLVTPDFRIGLLLVIITALATNVVTTRAAVSVLVVYGLVLGLVLGMGRKVLAVAVWYVLLLVGVFVCSAFPHLPLLPWLGIMFSLMARSFPTYVMMWLVATRVPMGQMMASLARTRVSGTFLMVLTVVYRYVPTLLSEIHIIWSVSRLRYTTPTWQRWLRHPVRQMENLLIPVLMRSGRIADELSAVAVCKGMHPGVQRSERVTPHIGIAEIAMVVCTLAVTAACGMWLQ